MTAKLFEAALGIAEPWSVSSVEFDEAAKVLTVLVDFKPGTRFAISGPRGSAPGARHREQDLPASELLPA